MTQLPIVVDLDDTLANTDFFFESLLLFIKQNPFNVFRVLIWILKNDRARLKSKIADSVTIDVSVIPYNLELINWIKDKKKQGHAIILATASDYRFADAVANHLGLFDQVLATRNDHNLKGANKEQKLIELFGAKGFMYAGDSEADLKVWRSAQSAIYVGSSDELRQKIQTLTHLEKQISVTQNKSTLFSAIRIHQWVKNALIFIPLLTSHNLFELGKTSHALLAFLAFSLCASAVYIINDFFDLQDDRRHRTKQRRAFASGQISIIKGGLICLVCLFASLIFSLSVGVDFFLVMLVYFITTLLYSLILKSKMMIDIILLAGLYTLRIIAGAVAINVDLSFWLLAFSMFIFLSLAIMKRYIELLGLENSASDKNSMVRGYQLNDIKMLSSLGTASGFIAVLIMALYVNSPDVTQLYSQPEYLWAVCPVLLFWTGRIWLQANRGKVDDDPVSYVIKDTQSWICIIALIILFYLAI